MIDLNELHVSLTKHGAHKVYRIMREVGPEHVLGHVDDDALDIHIDTAQAEKNLSIGRSGEVPAYWNKAKELGDLELRSLTLLSICHSHHSLIETLIASKSRLGNGLILRDHIIGGKAYTNLSNNFLKLGFCLSEDDNGFEYDFGQIFGLEGFSEPFLSMIRDKLVTCGLADNATDTQVVDAALSVALNQVVGLTSLEYRTWLTQGAVEFEDDYDPLEVDNELLETDQLQFVPGHIQRSPEDRPLRTSGREISVTQLHNRIQNQLFELLSRKYGAESVGTEQLIGNTNRVDLVVKADGETHFYEIKTSKFARIAIRQAIPQLLEYAFYPNQNRADVLVIVAPGEPTRDDVAYIGHLRSRFGIPIEYYPFSAT